MEKKNKSKLLELAHELLSELSPNGVVQMNNLFESLKFDEKSKQQVNFSLAMPPEMKSKILNDIGICESVSSPVRERHLPYVNMLDRLMKIGFDKVAALSNKDMVALIWKEGRRIGLHEYDLQNLSAIIPSWISKISKKKNVEISPRNIYEISQPSKVSNSSSVYFKGIVGKSEKMKSVFSCLERIGKSNLSILLQGESGTGKELIAHAIHRISGAEGNFIPVNCGALPDSVIESELFGYEKGAFTGAAMQKKGYFEISDKGTMFLDEITETSLNTQVKLLRVLQEQQFFRVGGVKPVNIKTRIIAATNKNMANMVRDDMFRHDLYYRINEMTITLPPLRDRNEDIPFLVEHFLKTFSLQNEKQVPEVSKSAYDLISSYSWPGNIRELENALKRAVVMSDKVIEPIHLPERMRVQNNDSPDKDESFEFELEPGTLDQLVAKAEKKIIESALMKNKFNVSKTADLLQVSRRTLQRKIKTYNIAK